MATPRAPALTTSPTSRPLSALPPYSELRRLLVRSSSSASDPAPEPASPSPKRAHPHLGPRPSAPPAASDGPRHADALLERALLRTWRLLSDPHSGSARELLARSFDRKCWRRLALLLFSSSQWLVDAAAAVLEAALCPLPPASLDRDQPTGDTSDSITDTTDSRPPLLALWPASVVDSVCDKLQDCAALLAALPDTGGHRCDASTDEPTVAVASRLVHILGAAVTATVTRVEDRRPTDCSASRTGLEVVLVHTRALALLHYLSKPEPTRERAPPALLLVQLAALRELSSLQRQHIATAARPTVETVGFLPAPLLLLYLAHLSEPVATGNCLRIQRARLYLELLTSAAPYQDPSPDVDTVLAICDALLVAQTDASLQHAALGWLLALLGPDIAPPSRVEHAEAIARAVRLSGGLRTLSWLLTHSERPVRAHAASVLSMVERRSPPADLARALIEQGCVAIFRVVVEQQHGSDPDPGAEMAGQLIQWTRRELGERRPFLVRACCHAVGHSTNAALRANVVLALHILRSEQAGRATGDGIRTALEAESFVDDVLLPAIEDGEHEDGASGGFARALLSVLANTCDPLSLLKLQARRQSTSHALYGADGSTEDEENPTGRTLTICCADGASVAADLDLLAANSARVRQHCASCPPTTRMTVKEAGADAVRLAVALLSPVTAVSLASEEDAALLDALAAARALETPAAWHVAARTLSGRLSVHNWATLALGALRVRHPALAIRAVRHGIASDSTDADLIRVASAMSREFFRDW